MEVIKVPNVTAKDHHYDAWINAKVVSKEGVYRLVGWYGDITAYIRTNRITALVHMQYIQRKKVRWGNIRMYKDGEDLHIFFAEPSVKPWGDVQRKWEAWSWSNYDKRISIRRIPAKWTPVCEKLIRL